MKVAVSIPDDVFDRAEQLARDLRMSRSQFYSHALSEYLGRHAPDEVTEAMDRVLAELGESVDGFVGAAGQRTLERSAW